MDYTSQKIIVPVQQLYDYIKSSEWCDLKNNMVGICGNKRKKSDYKKFCKRLKKAMKWLPSELDVEIYYNGKE